VAEALAEVGQREQAAAMASQAATMARSTTDPDGRRWAAVAEALAKVGL
jgi:hypothetical protein